MNKRIIVFLCFVSLLIPYSAFSQSKGVRRFAIVVGANDGGSSRNKLLYAISDAAAVMKVLNGIGSVSPDDSFLLFQPKRENLINALSTVYSAIEKTKANYSKTEIIFYYSGHSDEEGILLSNDRVTYSELKKTIESIPADVRIAILDSCYSGVFTQMKGGVKRPPFILDPVYSMKGNAFITSSSRDEVSQESELIKGSFFTHYLVLGLRGAADVTQDKKITLNEAYQYAYRETLFRTEKTAGGAQHPNYNIQMSGTGDVVLTDIKRGTVLLTFEDVLEGKISIYGKQNHLAAEFSKAYGQEVTLSFEKGEYVIIQSNSSGTRESRIVLKDKPLLIKTNDFSATRKEQTILRGDYSNSSGNQKETLIGSEKLKLSGYASVIVKFGPPVLGHKQLFVGGKACLLINNSFAVGVGGYGLTYPTKRDDSYYNESDTSTRSSYRYPKVQCGYGGGVIEYFFNPKSLFCFSTGILIGAGGVSFSSKSYESEYDNTENNTSAFFVMEPELGAHVNISNYVRIGVTGSYRYTNGINKREYHDNDFRGVYFSLVASAGWF